MNQIVQMEPFDSVRLRLCQMIKSHPAVYMRYKQAQSNGSNGLNVQLEPFDSIQLDYYGLAMN